MKEGLGVAGCGAATQTDSIGLVWDVWRPPPLLAVACILLWYRRLCQEAADPVRFDSNPRVEHSGGSGRGRAKEGEG